MEIILLERIEKLGGIGDVVNVKNGFARNYLLPNNKALRANDTNRKLFEANRGKIEADNAERRGEAEGRAKDFDGKQIVLIRQASNTGQLYGSVSVRDIVDALAEDGLLHGALLGHREHDDRELVGFAERERFGIHHHVFRQGQKDRGRARIDRHLIAAAAAGQVGGPEARQN